MTDEKGWFQCILKNIIYESTQFLIVWHHRYRRETVGVIENVIARRLFVNNAIAVK